MEAILALPPDERRLFVTHIRGQQRDRSGHLNPEQRESFLAMTPGGGRCGASSANCNRPNFSARL